MAKQVVAVTDIMHDKVLTKAGEILDAKRFTREQLTRFYERGVIRIADDAELTPALTLDDVDLSSESEPKAVTSTATNNSTPTTTTTPATSTSNSTSTSTSKPATSTSTAASTSTAKK